MGNFIIVLISLLGICIAIVGSYMKHKADIKAECEAEELGRLEELEYKVNMSESCEFNGDCDSICEKCVFGGLAQKVKK